MTVPASQMMQVRDAICAVIKAQLPGFDVAGHHGRFSDVELRKFATGPSAVRVALLALERPQSVGEGYVDYLARFGLFVVTRDGAAVGDRDLQALCAVEAITVLAQRARWGVGAICMAAEGVTAQNLYSVGGQDDGVALWALDLRQPVRLQTEDDSASVTLQAWLGVAPNVGPAHRDDYVELGRPPA